MKKLFIILTSFFAAVFVFALVVLKYCPEKPYTILYPEEPFLCEKDGAERTCTLAKGDYVVYGSYYGQPLLWKYVLDEKEPVLQNVYIIDFKPYGDISSEWETSTLRRFLNSEDIFSFGDKSIIKNGEFFVLSEGQISSLAEEDRVKKATPQAIHNSGARSLMLRRYCWYWTNSKVSTTSLCTLTVTQKGTTYKTYITDPVTGVCPAFQLKSKDITVTGGKGTREEPYIMKGADHEK